MIDFLTFFQIITDASSDSLIFRVPLGLYIHIYFIFPGLQGTAAKVRSYQSLYGYSTYRMGPLRQGEPVGQAGQEEAGEPSGPGGLYTPA